MIECNSSNQQDFQLYQINLQGWVWSKRQQNSKSNGNVNTRTIYSHCFAVFMNITHRHSFLTLAHFHYHTGSTVSLDLSLTSSTLTPRTEIASYFDLASPKTLNTERFVNQHRQHHHRPKSCSAPVFSQEQKELQSSKGMGAIAHSSKRRTYFYHIRKKITDLKLSQLRGYI